MKGETVIYDGRVVAKEGFRVFIYSFNDETKLVNSWQEYQDHIASGIWFARNDAPQLAVIRDFPVTEDPIIQESLRVEKKKGRK